MSAVTLAQAQAQLALWMAADASVAASQEYRIGDRTLKRADAAHILDRIKYWSGEVDRLSVIGNRRRLGPTFRRMRLG